MATRPYYKTPEGRFSPLKNPLGDFSSYNYQLSLYMVSPSAYNDFVTNKTLTPSSPGVVLVAQSGGINRETEKRAEGFEHDYFLDNLMIKGYLTPSGTSSPAMNFEVTFTVTEQYGFSFVNNLKKAKDAISNVGGVSSGPAPLKQQFIIGIRFIGYDATGHIDTTNPGTQVELFQDVWFTKFSFKLDGKSTVYNISAAPISYNVAYGVKNGMVAKESHMSGRKVKDFTDALAETLNREQELLFPGKGGNHYSFTYIGDAGTLIGESSVIGPSAGGDKSQWASSVAKQVSDVTPALERNSPPDSQSRIIGFKGDTPIPQALQQIISQSNYVVGPIKQTHESTTDGDYNPEPLDSRKTAQWLRIIPEVTYKGWVREINDSLYYINYQIGVYEVPNLVTAPTIKTGAYPGPYKRYKYWYTGENSEIVSYSQTINNSLFINVVLPPTDNGTVPTAAVAPNRPAPTNIPGQQGYGNQSAASYITNINDPVSFAEAKIEILGDPDFITNSHVATVASVASTSGFVYIEIDFNEAKDYDDDTGVMSINDQIGLAYTYPESMKVEGVSFLVTTVTSNFKGGKFTQELKLRLNAGSSTDLEGTVTTDADAAGSQEAREAAATFQRESRGKAIDPENASETTRLMNRATTVGLLPAPTAATVSNIVALQRASISFGGGREPPLSNKRGGTP